MSWEERGSLLPVTCLEYVTVAEEEILLAGEGPKLKAFSADGVLLTAKETLAFRVLHGIRPLSRSPAPPPSTANLLIFGQKAFRVVSLSRQGQTVCLECACDVAEASDWILDASLLRWEGPENWELAFITAHNVLVSYVMEKGHAAISHYHSEVNCILYSALLVGDSLEGLMVASGTVFNKILLWHVSSESQSQVSVRLTFTGHQGVIFSVKVNSDQSKLVSASDDRTVRLWAIAEDWRSHTGVVESGCVLVLYGHTARVWQARLLPECLVSVGEDAVCRVWSYGGKTLGTFRGHRGKSIWSMAVDRRNKTVATGGGDCSIRVYDLTGLARSVSLRTWAPPARDERVQQLPRAVFLMAHTALCLTDQGSLYAGRLSVVGDCEVAWTLVHQDIAFSNYSIAQLSDFGVLALGNIQGSVGLLRLDKSGTVLTSTTIQPYSGKVFSLNWATPQGLCDGELLFTCGPDGGIVCWQVNPDSLKAKKLSCLTLPASKHRWATAISVLPSPPHSFLALCGDRRGSLHLYRLSPGDMEGRGPVQTLQGVHGCNGVTHICCHKEAVYTSGRNGLCRKYVLEGDRMVEVTKFKPVKGLEWIERVCFTEEDTLFLGFHGASLVVHSSVHNRRLLELACGGGHRSYATSPLREMLLLGHTNVVFVKQAEICYGVVRMESGFARSLFQPAFVGLEAESLTVLESDYDSGRALVAVGSEDCTISLVRVTPGSSCGSGSLEVLHSLQGHASSVKALSSCPAARGTLLFSGGARASLKVWSVGSTGKDLEVGLKTGLFLHEEKNKRRKQRAKFKPLDPEVPPECRVMSLTSFPLACVLVCQEGQDPATSQSPHYVAAGCSDAVVRQYVYNDEEHSFFPLPPLKTTNKCVLHVCHFFHRVLPATSTDEGEEELGSGSTAPRLHPILCSASTDGHVTLWGLLPVLTSWGLRRSSCDVRETEQGAVVSPVSRFKVHQSGVNKVAVRSSCAETGLELGLSCHIMVTVGDDNALGLVHLTVSGRSPDLSVEVFRRHVCPTAHASSITGVCFISENTVMSTSIDQRLSVWDISREDRIELISSHTHDVADSSSLAVYNTRHGGMVALVCGVGLQYYTYVPTTTP